MGEGDGEDGEVVEKREREREDSPGRLWGLVQMSGATYFLALAPSLTS